MRNDKYTLLAQTMQKEMPNGAQRAFCTAPWHENNRVICFYLVGDPFETFSDFEKK